MYDHEIATTHAARLAAYVPVTPDDIAHWPAREIAAYHRERAISKAQEAGRKDHHARLASDPDYQAWVHLHWGKPLCRK
jgi:hypothetical protein